MVDHKSIINFCSSVIIELRYSTDYENYYGRKEYASTTAGGYYTVRLAILEKLKEMKLDTWTGIKKIEKEMRVLFGEVN